MDLFRSYLTATHRHRWVVPVRIPGSRQQADRGDDGSNTAVEYPPAQKSLENDERIAADPTSFRRKKGGV
jgi:hypothetical protein